MAPQGAAAGVMTRRAAEARGNMRNVTFVGFSRNRSAQ